MKTIKRKYYNFEIEVWEDGLFICVGQWADGHYAYTRLDRNGNRIEEEEGAYFQCRGVFDGKDNDGLYFNLCNQNDDDSTVWTKIYFNEIDFTGYNIVSLLG